jgi:hypothetical protein
LFRFLRLGVKLDGLRKWWTYNLPHGSVIGPVLWLSHMERPSRRVQLKGGIMKIVMGLMACGAATLLNAAQSASPKSAEQPFSITIAAANAEVSAGSPVDIRVQLTNTSNRDMTLGAGFWIYGNIDGGLDYVCYDETGKGVQRDFTVVGDLGDRAVPTLKPCKSLEEVVTISTACDLSRPGKYQIQVSRKIPNDSRHRAMKSNTIWITVKPSEQPAPTKKESLRSL